MTTCQFRRFIWKQMGGKKLAQTVIKELCQTSEHQFKIRRLSVDLKELSECDLLLYFRLPLSSNPCFESGFCKWLFCKAFVFCVFLMRPWASNYVPAVLFLTAIPMP